MRVHLVDGTYELFRAYFAWPSAKGNAGQEVNAAKGLVSTLRRLVATPGVTHVACAFDTVIESFRNDLFPGYKTGEGLDPNLLNQFGLAERACEAFGVVAWRMIEFEADDALATAAERWSREPGVDQVVICSPDKDLSQCVSGDRIVCWDRMRDIVYAEADVREKFGVSPASIPDYLALVGDTADGIPGVPRWGKKAAATLLAHYGHLEAIPHDDARWEVTIRGSRALAEELARHYEAALLYRRLATLRRDVPLGESLDDLRYRGADRDKLTAVCEEVADFSLLETVAWRSSSD
ncbi:MAG TPA: 5'-3' exonuclease H3TH domain-containing protein [Polyangiaceae bacterium]|nr:5'-3' exonuclease H3TH domain-containing protein [Polyangiaceae bacterium]